VPTLNLQVSAGADDGVVDSFIGNYSSVSDPVVGRDSANTLSAWFRFAGFTLPRGSIVHSAVLELRANVATVGSPQTRIVAERGAAAPAAPASYADYWARNRTTAAVAWNGGTLSTSEYTALPDVSAVVREVLSEHTLTALLFFLENTTPSGQHFHGIRGQDNYSEPATLAIEYTAPAPELFDHYYRRARGPNVRAR
jgi:hypothetical protein